MYIEVAVLVVVLTTFGQLFLKQSARLSHYSNLKLKALALIVLGYSCFILTIFFSYQLMKLISMKYFTVIMSVNFIAIMFAAYFFIGEPLETRKVIGTVFVAIGIFIFMN